jgi:hypothetical protein
MTDQLAKHPEESIAELSSTWTARLKDRGKFLADNAANA